MQNEILTTGLKIRAARKAAGLTKLELAKACGVSEMTIWNWESGIYQPSGKHLFALAGSLNESIDNLCSGRPTPPHKRKKGPLMYIPVMPWTAEHLIANTTLHATDWRFTTTQLSEKGFALIVNDDSLQSMGPQCIPAGALIFVEPKLEPTNGDLVVAACTTLKNATAKKFVVDGPNTYLKPLNPDYKTILIDDSWTILGVVKRVEIDF